MKITALVAFALAASGAPETAKPTTAPASYQSVVKTVGQFYTDTGVSKTFTLKEGEQRLVVLAAPAAGHHVLMATCDEHCGDIDLQTFDENGLELGADHEVDDNPSVDLGKHGRTSTVVKMAGCSEENGCEVKVGLLKVR